MTKSGNSQSKKVLFILPHSVRFGPSQRFRVGLFLPVLEQHNIEYELANFIREESEAHMYIPGLYAAKLTTVLSGFIRRSYIALFTAWRYDYVFVQRGASPFGPPVFEWLIAKVWRRKMIFDFDDAIWMSNSATQNKVIALFKAFWKVKYICKWSYKVVGGNEFLCDYARKYNKSVVRIPTCVDTRFHHNIVKEHKPGKVTIGWTGSHTTLRHLSLVEKTLQQLRNDFNFDILIIANERPKWGIDDYTFITWNEKTEVEDLAKIDIGIMPLILDDFSKGKCGFKLIQYLSLGMPALASPVGVNSEIIDHGVNGFICDKPEEWKSALAILLKDAYLRNTMGAAGRKKIEEAYSVELQAIKFLNLFS